MIGKAGLGAASLVALAIATPAQASDCAKLAGLALEDGKVTAATLVGAGQFPPPAANLGPPPGTPYARLPAFCRVEATLTPTADSSIRVEVWMPADRWNGKFVGIGNGVWAGQLSISQLGEPLSRGYAVATTDTGHSGDGLSAEWAIGHPEKLVDFGHRAVHRMTVTAKQAIRAYYGRMPDHSLWNSCSTGGRQGLMAAYRYPADYDAISAMAPANPWPDLLTQAMWIGWQPQRYGVKITPAELGLVHGAAMKRCDARDGLADGVIGRPLQCDFDPASLQCGPGQTAGCLSGGQVQAFRGFYGGVRASDGAWLLPGWPRGAEMQLFLQTMGPEPFSVATSFFRDLVFRDRPAWDWRTTAFDDYLNAGRSFDGNMINVPVDGLGPFFARGGKLLLSHGWNDGLIPAANTLAFHHQLYDAIPAEAAQNQLRLFMAPGMDHCAGGEGPNAFDTLGTIDAWASTGEAPNRIVATRLPGPNMPDMPPMSRPLCPWPLVERYDGSGDPMVAGSFSCALPD